MNNFIQTLIGMIWILTITKFTVPLYNRKVFLSAKPAKKKSNKQILEGTIIVFILALADVVNALILILIKTVIQKVIIGITIAIARSWNYYFDMKKKQNPNQALRKKWRKKYHKNKDKINARARERYHNNSEYKERHDTKVKKYNEKIKGE